LRWSGLARELVTTPPPQIEQARMRAALRLVEERIENAPHGVAEDFRARVTAAAQHLEQAFALWRQHVDERAHGVASRWRETRRRARHEVRKSRREWKSALRMIARVPATA
jgi:hypothetical protein